MSLLVGIARINTISATQLKTQLKTPPNKFVVILSVLCLVSTIARAEQSDAEKAGFTITPEMRAAMNMRGSETPKAWLGNAIQYNYQADELSLEVGQKYHLPEARKLCSAGDPDSCATARNIEKWLSWAKSTSAFAAEECDRTPCDRVPNDLIPSALRGKLWVLHAWASWCPYCRLDHMRLVEIGPDRHMKIVSLLYQDTEDAAARYLADHGNPYNDGSIRVSREILKSLDLRSVPATFVISPGGNILRRFQGTLGGRGQEALEKYSNK